MEQQVKTKVQFTDNYNAFTNLENNDSLSTGFGKIHYDLGYLNSEDQRQESEINAIAQAGSKNICPIGTETHSSEIGFGTEYSFPMPEGAYIISFTGTMVAPIQFNVYSESGTRIALVDIHTIQEAEAGIRFVLNDNASKCKFWYDTSDNYILSNIMIRDANITDNTFQPYSPTNRQLYDLVNEKQNSLTFDGTYDSDLNPVATVSTVSNSINDLDVSSVGGSGKYISAISETNGKISATPTAFDTTLSSSSTDGNVPSSKTVFDDQQRQEVEIAELVDSGAKNRIIFDGVGTGVSNVGTSYTSNGITFEVQSDGTIRATGTISSGNSYCYLYAGTGRINIIDAFDGKHVLSGNPQSASASTYRLWYKVGSQTAVSVCDSSIILPEVTGETTAVLGLQVDAPQTNLDITFKPMICTAVDWAVSQKFVPYCPSLPEVYEEVEKNESDILSIYGLGEEIIGTSETHKDLNTYKTAGTYFCLNSTNAGYVDNKPIGGSGFRLVVEKVTSSTTIRQTFTKPTDASRIYVRTFSNNSWSNWFVFEGTAVT